jgi:NTP pyrophosphatase (non-canonical NTP hydrolase)
LSTPPYITREDRVAEFLKAAGFKTHVEAGEFDVHIVCFAEELQEFFEAVENYRQKNTVENRAQLAKEWADVQVTLSNLAWYFNLDGQIAFNRVASNNLTKLIDGKIVRREDGKILKPEGYEKPDMKGL